MACCRYSGACGAETDNSVVTHYALGFPWFVGWHEVSWSIRYKRRRLHSGDVRQGEGNRELHLLCQRKCTEFYLRMSFPPVAACLNPTALALYVLHLESFILLNHVCFYKSAELSRFLLATFSAFPVPNILFRTPLFYCESLPTKALIQPQEEKEKRKFWNEE